MASSETVAHPRPAIDEELPPSKQLKLSVDDDIPLAASLVPQSRPETAKVSGSDVVSALVESVTVDTQDALILEAETPAEVGELPIHVKRVNVDTEGNLLPEKGGESVISHGRARITQVEGLYSSPTSVIVETVDVKVKAISIQATEEVPVDTVPNASQYGRSVEQPIDEETRITASAPNGNGLHVGDERIAPTVQKAGLSLLSDLGAGTSAVQRTKTSLCSYYRKKGCRHGASCRYAHGEEELKPRPDGSWDPTSERAKSLLQKNNVPVVKVDVEVPPPSSEEINESSVNSLSRCIVHVPRGWSVDHFKDFLTENEITYTTAKKRKGMSVAFVGFKTPDDVVKATKILDGKYVNKKQLKVAESRSRSWEKNAAGLSDISKNDNAAHDDMAEGINDAGMDDHVSDGDVGDLELAAISREGASGQIRNVCDAVTPLAQMPYEEQLNVKRDSITQVLKRLVRNTRKGIPSGVVLPDWIVSARDKGGLPCVLEGVLASPIVDGYRNKCEFSIGCSADGDRVVGFQIGSFREGILAVAEPTDCRNVSVIARLYAAAFQEFVQGSELAVWNKKSNSGFWRLLIVREGRAARAGDAFDGSVSAIAEVMLVVQVCPTGVSEERRKDEYAKMVESLVHAANSASPPLPLTALLVQDHEGISNVASPDAPLHPLVVPKSEHNAEVASGYIHDHISTLQFRISPTAFFQVNTLAAERLYTLVGDWAGLNSDTLLFDVCCGTGTIGLTLAHRVGLVVGIEMNASAVADAEKNARINNITNCRFVCSKAEDVMDSLLKEYLAFEEADILRNDSQAGDMKAGGAGHCAQLAQILQPSDSSIEEHQGYIEEEAVVLLSSHGTVNQERRADADQVEEAVGSESSRGNDPKRRFKTIVAIVDPPRVGLHPVVLKTLRLHSELRRLVYVSCNPQSLLANAVELCTPLSSVQNGENGKGGWRGRANWKGMSNVGQARQRVKKMPPSEPFKPVKAIAVDLFPHTVHCEMVMLLER